MHFISLKIPDVIQIIHPRHHDERGSFMELFRQQEFVAHCCRNRGDCADVNFVQDNLSCSRQGTLRGLHYQIERPQGKLVQVISGTIFDGGGFASEQSYLWSMGGLHLDADSPMSLWIPGFAHGFYVLSEMATVLLQVH